MVDHGPVGQPIEGRLSTVVLQVCLFGRYSFTPSLLLHHDIAPANAYDPGLQTEQLLAPVTFQYMLDSHSP